jgi:biotin transport system substrate-specific component
MQTQSAATLCDQIIPRGKAWIDGVLVVGASLLVALSAQVVVPLPYSPVPVTGQTFAILLVGALLGSRRGLFAILAYLAEGAAGLPVFAGGTGGAFYFFGPTGGYLLGFLPAVWVVGRLSEAGWDRRPWSAAVAMATGNIVILGCGAAWLLPFAGLEGAVTAGVLPFLPGDLLKIALAATLLPTGWKALSRLR